MFKFIDAPAWVIRPDASGSVATRKAKHQMGSNDDSGPPYDASSFVALAIMKERDTFHACCRYPALPSTHQ